MTKILGSVWFSSLRYPIIGIVLMNNGYEDKAYIGLGKEIDQRQDEEKIVALGGKFPVEIARKLIGG